MGTFTTTPAKKVPPNSFLKPLNRLGFDTRYPPVTATFGSNVLRAIVTPERAMLSLILSIRISFRFAHTASISIGILVVLERLELLEKPDSTSNSLSSGIPQRCANSILASARPLVAFVRLICASFSFTLTFIRSPRVATSAATISSTSCVSVSSSALYCSANSFLCFTLTTCQ